MKKRILSTILSLCMAVTMVLSLLPTQVVAQELTHLSHAHGQAATKSVAVQNIGPNEAAVDNDLYEKMAIQASFIKLIADIDIGTLSIGYEVTIDLNGHVLRAPYGGSVIKVENGGHLTLIDSNPDAEHKFTPNADGLWVLDETGGTKTVKGGVITGGNATGGGSSFSGNGGGVLIEGGGKLTMNGGSIVGCVSDKGTGNGTCGNGGGVYVAGGGAFEMNSGAAIIGCVSKSTDYFGGAGGGVHIEESGTFTMNGGNIRNCKAVYGGGVDDDGGQFIMNGGTIRDCAVTNEYGAGAAITSYGTILAINGTVISDGTWPVYVQHTLLEGTVIIGADADIQANVQFHRCATVYANGGTVKGDVVAVYSTTISIVEGVTQGTNIYGKITLEEGSRYDDSVVTVTYNIKGTDYATQILRSGSAATKPADPTNSAGATFLGWYRADGMAYDFTQPVTENITLTARFTAVTRKVETKEELTAALADDTVDVIKLGSDIAIDATLIVDRTVTLDLVGYMLEMKGSGSVIVIKDGGHLTLEDSDLTSTYYFTPDADGLWKWGTSGTKTVNGGVIYGGTGTIMYYFTRGGGVYIEGGGQFTMNGGSIVGCSADSGGGVVVACVDANGTFTMNGGAIIGCVADSGGGVETDGGGVGEFGTFIMNGGVIDSCVATDGWGGGVYASGPFTMGKAAAITNCKASKEGSGVFLGNSRSPHTLNGTITSEDANDGDYIFANNAQVTIGANAKINANITLAGGTIALADGVTSATVYGKITDGCFADGLVTATYKVNNADYAIQILRSGSTATQPATPAKTGYEFEGWYTADGTKWDYNTTVTEDTTLTGCLYVPVTNESELTAALADDTVDIIRLTADIDISASLTILRKVTLDLNGHVLKMTGSGSVIILDDKSGTTGDLTLMDSDPTAEHKFKVNGVEPWVLDDSGTEIVKGGVITGGTGSKIFSSNSAEGGGVVIGDGSLTMNGGNIVGCTAYLGGGLYIRHSGAFTMNGGSIVGGSADSTYGGVYVLGPTKSGSAGAVITLNGGLIKNNGKYAINVLYGTTIYANGGEVYGDVRVDSASKITSLPGHTGVTVFRGRTDINGGSGEENRSFIDWGLYYSGLGIYGNTTTGLIVTYMTDDVEYAKQVLPSGTLATRPDDPTTPGYIFGGWNKADGTAWDYATDTVTESITLYADLTAKTYTVTFDTAGGLDIATKTMIATYGKSLANMPVPRREGYVFLGWYDAIAGGKCYGNSDGSSANAYDKDGNTTLYAQWMEAPDCTVRFETDGGTMADPAEVGHKTNTPIAKPGDPTKAGYTFTGWYTDPTYTQLWNFDDWVTGEMMLYAGWKVNRYTITVKPENGEADIVITQDFGTDVTAPSLKRTGYVFAGWNVAFPATMPAENITITAQWTLCDHVASTAQPTCTASATCTECAATLAALGHDVKPGYVYDGDNHWKECTRCTDKLELAAHTGGAASCTEQSVCSTCGQSYGALKPGNHSGSLVWYSNITMHEHRYDCCGLVVTAYELHHWYDGKCADCGYICTHPKGEKSCDGQAHCDICGSDYAAAPGNHSGKLVWVTNARTHEQRYDCCGTVVTPAAAHEWKNGRCTVCGEVCSHTGGKANCHTKATCTVCGEQYGGTDKSVHDGGTEVRGARAAGCTEAGYTGDTHCKSCGEKISSGTDIPATGHTGGKATCVRGAVCEVCGNAYGETDPKNHASALVRVPTAAATVAAEGNIEHWRCPDCGALFADADGARGLEPGDVVTGKLAPSVRMSESDGEPWVKGSGESLKFEFDCDPDDVSSVRISEREVDYIRREDGVTVVLTPELLDELEPGTYDLTVELGDGLSIGTSFAVAAAPTNAALVIITVAAAVVVVGGGAAAAVILIRRKKH